MSKNEEKTGPIFDYTDFSYQQQKESFANRLRLQRLARQMDNAPDNTTDEQFEKWISKYDALRGVLEYAMSKRIVSIPREWLVTSAPKEIDWEQKESLEYVRADYMDALRDAAVDSRTPESVSGN